MNHPLLHVARRVATLGLLVSLSVVLSAASCDKKDDVKEPAKAETPTPTPNKVDGAPATKPAAAAAGTAPAKDAYPGFPAFARLNDAQRIQFKGIVEAEVCPCEGATVSLEMCLKDVSKGCAMSARVANMVGGGVYQGVKQTDIMAEIAKFIKSSKQTHTFDVTSTPYKGNPKSTIVMIEFADFKCPHCRMAAKVMDEVATKHKDDIVYYYKNFPLGSPQGKKAAHAALAAHEQGKFWPMHDMIFANQMKLTDASYEEFANKIGINVKRFKAGMQSPMIQQQVVSDKLEGQKANITGTPTLFINGKQYFGDKSVDAISKVIEEMKAAKK